MRIGFCVHAYSNRKMTLFYRKWSKHFLNVHYFKIFKKREVPNRSQKIIHLFFQWSLFKCVRAFLDFPPVSGTGPDCPGKICCHHCLLILSQRSVLKFKEKSINIWIQNKKKVHYLTYLKAKVQKITSGVHLFLLTMKLICESFF